MSRLAEKRCRNHPQREAVARCVGCGLYFCRECIVEHEERMTCAACLPPLGKRRARKRFFPVLTSLLRVTCGVFIVWLVFYAMGAVLVTLSTRYALLTLHDLPLFRP